MNNSTNLKTILINPIQQQREDEGHNRNNKFLLNKKIRFKILLLNNKTLLQDKCQDNNRFCRRQWHNLCHRQWHRCKILIFQFNNHKLQAICLRVPLQDSNRLDSHLLSLLISFRIRIHLWMFKIHKLLIVV